MLKAVKTILILFAIVMLGCERDDICAAGTSTTPRLLIEFYDDGDLQVLKSVTRLTVYGEGLVTDENGNSIQPIGSSNATILFNTNENSASLPLLVGIEGEVTTTRFILESNTNLRLDDNTSTSSNIDILEINYVPKFEYISRACGFKSIFTQLSVQIIQDDDNWTSSTTIAEAITENLTVENENEAHVYIYH